MRRLILIIALVSIVISAFISYQLAVERAGEPMKPPVRARPAGEVEIYFTRWDNQTGKGSLAPVKRTLNPGEEALPAAMKDLLEGPTSAESTAGLVSNIPEGTWLLDFSQEEGVAYLNFNQTVESGGGSASIGSRLAQIVYTATAIKGVDAVRIMIDGKEPQTFGGEGFIIDHPLTRTDVPKEF